jgi:plastocyanin
MLAMAMSMHRTRLGILAVLIALAFQAASAGHRGSAVEASATASATKTVQIKGFAFKPASVKVERGSRVSFANSSDVTHTATGADFDTKRIAPGKSAAIRFKKAGTFAYHCKIHSFMKGKVVVE